MLKSKKCNLKFKVFGVGLFALAIFFGACSLTFQAKAQSPTPEATAAAEEDLEDKIEGIREAVKEKVAEKNEEIGLGGKRAFAGAISDISNNTITLETENGKKQAQTTDETTFVDENRKEISLEDLVIESYIIALGYLEGEDLLDTRRVVISEKPEPIELIAVYGKVSDKSSDEEENVLTIKTPEKQDIYQVEVAAKTELYQRVNDESEEIEFDDLNIDDLVIVIGTPDETGSSNLTAKIVSVISVSPTTSDKEASPTATPEEE